jgi:4-hydroxybenzoyl-CoA reductase subunit beta
MLRLPRFDVQTPETVEEAVAALAHPEVRLVAGGSDILPNLKHRLDQPPALVSLARVKALRGIRRDGDTLIIGAGTTLTEVSEHDDVRTLFPSLAAAAGQVASPLIRNMGTIGGNVNLDVRCRYVNQTEFWREAIGGGCLKSEGNVCHVVPGGRNCVAAMSSDCVPVLISLDAELVQHGRSGERVLPVAEYFRADGTNHTTREVGEITTAIRIPVPEGATRAAYAKWTVRRSIDFPLVSVALRFDLESDAVDAKITAAKVVVGVLNPKPRIVSKLDDIVGKKLSDPAVAQIVSERVHKSCKPLENVPYEAPYRRQMLKVHTRRAIEALVAAG